jgi:poly-D-alanine transfer protein DltD
MTEEEQLKALHEWDDERGQKSSSNNDLSDMAMVYLAQIKDLQKQYEEERLGLQRLEMSIRGFHAALKEELEKGL